MLDLSSSKNFLLPLALACLLGEWSYASGTVSAKNVELKSLPRPGSWFNVPKDFKTAGGDSLFITASEKTDLYNSMDDGTRVATAPMLLFPADERFVLTAAVSVDFNQEYDGGFLVVYSDADHWVKLLFEKSHYGPFSIASNVTNVDADDCVNTDAPGKKAYLRITRAKDLFGLYYSFDGKQWFYIRYFRFAVKKPLQVGFASQSPSGRQCTTIFSGIRYSTHEVADFWTGEPKP